MENSYLNGIFDKIEPTLENMISIADFNRIVMNYFKMIRLENGKQKTNN